MNGDPLTPEPCDEVEHEDEEVLASQANAYQLFVYGLAADVV